VDDPTEVQEMELATPVPPLAGLPWRLLLGLVVHDVLDRALSTASSGSAAGAAASSGF
jgi:hypothetical protein